jgi:hypothetical protein
MMKSTTIDPELSAMSASESIDRESIDRETTRRATKLLEIKRAIAALVEPTNQTESLAQFRQIYGAVEPTEWLDVDFMMEVLNYIALMRPNLVSLGVRFSVQVNLFLETVRSYASNPDEMIRMYGSDIACFALTEDKAGILSGLQVDTQFKILPGKDGGQPTYLLNTNSGKKQWISQGLVATHGLIFASNEANHRDCRIFHIVFGDHGTTVIRNAMPAATSVSVNRTLDLAEIQLVSVHLPANSVLSGTIDASRRQLLGGVLRGRIVISEVTCNSLLGLVRHTKQNVEEQIDKFAAIPHLDLIRRWERELESYTLYLAAQRRQLFDTKDIQRINCHKVHVTEIAIAIYARLGVLFGTKTFGHGLEFQTLIINKVAEGDATILRLAIIGEHFGDGSVGSVISAARNPGVSWMNLVGLVGLKTTDAVVRPVVWRVPALKRIGLPINPVLARTYMFDHLDEISDSIIRANIRTIDIDPVNGYR